MTASRREFDRLVDGQEPIDLVEVLLDLADDAYPQVDRALCRAELDRLGARVAETLAAWPAPQRTLRRSLGAVSFVLFRQEGFRGNTETYYDPRNSYLNEVLRRRLGIPISLALVYVQVAVRAGLNVYGVGTPGHFLVGADGGGETLYVDPFHDGDVLSRSACQHRLARLAAPGPAPDLAHFRPAAPEEIVARVLRNLKAAYVMDNRWAEALPVQQRLVRLLPKDRGEQRDLGLVYLRLGQAHAALECLEPVAQCGSAEELEAIEPYLQAARRLRAELN